MENSYNVLFYEVLFKVYVLYKQSNKTKYTIVKIEYIIVE